MSVLQKIIEQMYVEPELLAQLDEEQKQILFIKLREEQVRRWQAYEALHADDKITSNDESSSRKVGWRTGSDGNVWVWVMGDHVSDRTIDEILDAETIANARLLADQEKNDDNHEDEHPLPSVSFEQSVYEDADNLTNSKPDIAIETSSSVPDATSAKIQPNGIVEPVSVSDNDKLNFATQRQSEIYQSIKSARERITKEAEREAEKERAVWEEQERKAKAADIGIRKIAQRAREQHRQHSLRTSTSILPALIDTKSGASIREAIRSLPRPPKPKCRSAIVEWFKQEEYPNGTGLDPKTRLVAPWFHGIISREHAELLLKNKPSGAFLVRVSERIWGYTVSYVVRDGVSKHFLVERIPQGYQFLGTNQIVHDQLYDLVSYHETAPITAKGNEILKWSVGQGGADEADYADLMTVGHHHNHNHILRL